VNLTLPPPSEIMKEHLCLVFWPACLLGCILFVVLLFASIRPPGPQQLSEEDVGQKTAPPAVQAPAPDPLSILHPDPVLTQALGRGVIWPAALEAALCRPEALAGPDGFVTHCHVVFAKGTQPATVDVDLPLADGAGQAGVAFRFYRSADDHPVSVEVAVAHPDRLTRLQAVGPTRLLLGSIVAYAAHYQPPKGLNPAEAMGSWSTP
jgi:hypothetical protein